MNTTKNDFRKRPLILISNDDGYTAKGLLSLVEMVKDLGDLLVCAPESGRSGFSCAYSTNTPLYLEKKEEVSWGQIWACSGTPTDCIKIALDRLCNDRKPDLIISGINHGDNASINSHYSGTMGATLEGCMKYFPSLAFSLCNHSIDADFTPLRPLIQFITKRILKEGLPRGVCLNVNFPNVPHFKGVRICRMAYGTWSNEVEKCVNSKGRSYYWIVGEYTNDEPQCEDTDNWALAHGYVAITPTTIDLTDYNMLQRMRNWVFEV